MKTAAPALAIVETMLTAARQSCAELRARISNVRPAGIIGGREALAFELDGKPHRGTLRGRNRDLCLGFGAEQDAGIAVRVLLDGDAQPLEGNP